MSTQFTDTTRDEQVTLPQIPAPPQVSPPHPPPRPKRGRWVMIATVILVLAIILGGGAFVLALVAQRPSAPVKPTPVPTTVPTPGVTVTPTPGVTVTPTPGVTVTPTPEAPTPVPGVLLGPQACPAPMNNPAYWEKIVGTKSGVNHVEGVSCANIVDTPSLQALVTVRANSPAATLDVYVYNNISGAKPAQIFKLQGLLKGDAKISGYNTVMTAEVDKNSAVNTGKPLSTMTADLFREFDWSGKQGTLVQTAFPGIFPDLTRYQAAADQALVNKGQDTWKNDPKQVAQKLVVQFFGWHGTLTSTIISGGGAKDVNATVKVAHPIQGATKPPYVNVTLSRLEGNTHNMWVAIGVEDGTGALTSVTARSLVASPVKFEGKGDSFGGAIGGAYILDHLYTTVGQAHVSASNGPGQGISPFSLLVSYDTSFKQGPQEGIVELQLTSTMGPTAYSAVMVKVLLDSQPRVVQGPVSCPIAVSNATYWTPFLSTPPNPGEAEQVICGNLLGKSSLQAMVVAREIIGGGPTFRSVFVFDNITALTPKLLFKAGHLLHGDAQISGYSTIMTAEVDLNSAINKDKPDDKLTTDLFREFQWSSKAGKFVQVAFPGIFPDLTRYQAEQDQIGVNVGIDTWKNNPKQVALNLAQAFFGWNKPMTATLISGGGAKDVNATVKVEGKPFQGMKSGPSVNVKLSRLEGNTHNMWVAIGVEDGAGALTSIKSESLVASPVKLEGTWGAYENLIGHAYILDHLYTTVGHAKIPAMPGLGMTNSPYSILVTYDVSFKQGPQEGIVEIAQSSPVGGPYVMVKVLLDPQPQVALGPMSCPVAQQDAGYWETNFSISPTTVTCGNLKGPAYITLLALLTVAPSDSKPGHLYVYDLTEARPVQLFSMETSDAKISAASTIITADIDPNSSINKGKSKLTPDLFREFAWSGKAFVQVAFSGMYPDLTRWQAEDDQALVNKGQETWKRDPLKTAGHFVAQFLPSPASNPPKLQLVFGGGAKDPQANVNVTFPAAGGGTPRITKITLSRLAWGTNSIWEVSAVQADWMSITSPKSGLSTYISTPVTVSGSGPTFEGQLGVAQVLDHLYQEIGGTSVMAPSGGKSQPFTVTFPYTSSFRTGAQEGIVILRHAGGAPFDYGVVLVKVLVNP